MHPRIMLAALSLGLILLACVDHLAISSSGDIRIRLSTGGSDPDPDGYSITIDGIDARLVGVNGTITVTGMSPGTHTIRLQGVSSNCVVAGNNPQVVEVGSGGPAQVDFTVTCSAGPSSGFVVAVTTTGSAPDSDGYLLQVAGTDALAIATDDTVTVRGLVPGIHLIQLDDVADNCLLLGGNPQRFTVVSGKTVLVRLKVSCS